MRVPTMFITRSLPPRMTVNYRGIWALGLSEKVYTKIDTYIDTHFWFTRAYMFTESERNQTVHGGAPEEEEE